MISSGPSQLALAISQANQERAYSDNYLAQAGHLALASVVDFGTSVYNSIDLFDMFEDAETDSVLDGLGANSTAQFYQDNEDLVNGISFIGGMFVPGMAAVKGSQMLRAGLKGSHFLNPASQRAKLRTVSRMVREGKSATEEYRKLKFGTMRNAVAQGAVDNAAAEVAILASLNAHPLMEDYMEDLPSNFAASLAFGSAISGVIDIAATSNALKTVAGHTLTRAHQPVLDVAPVKAAMAGDGTDFKMMQQAVKDLDGILAGNGYSIETKAFATSMKLNMEESMRRTAERVAQATKVSHEDADFHKHVESILSKPEAFGVDRVTFYKVPAKSPKSEGLIGKLTSLIKEVKPVKEGDDSTFKAHGIYSPQFDMFVDEDSAARIASAVDAGHTPETINSLAKKAKAQFDYTKGLDTSENLLIGGAADVDADYLVKLKLFDSLSVKELGEAKIHKTDLGSLQGAAARIRKEEEAIGALRKQVADMQIELDDQALSQAKRNKIEASQKKLEKQATVRQEKLDALEINITDSHVKASTLKRRKIVANHLQQVTTASKDFGNIVDEVSPELANVLNRWFRGEAGTDQAVRESVAQAMKTGDADEVIKELLTSEHSKSVRTALGKVADKDGFVHLAQNPSKAKGIGVEIDTFTTSAEAGTKLKAVPVASILGAVKLSDGTTQFLVAADTATSVRKNLRGLVVGKNGAIITGDNAIKGKDIARYANDETASWVIEQSRRGMEEGFGMEELARRSNLDTDSVKRILGMPDTDVLGEVGGVSTRYSNAKDLKDYMSNRQRLLRGTDDGNLTSHYEYTKMLESGADRKLLEDWAMETTLDLMSTSKSKLVNSLMGTYGARSPEGMANFRGQMALLKRSLGLVNDELAGNRLITSADMYARRMSDAGKLINHFGDKFTAAYNETVEHFIGPMNGSLTKIAQNDAEIVALNTAIQVHRSIGDGLIKFVDGVFYSKAVGDKQWKEVIWEGKVFKIPETMPSVRQFLAQAANVGQELQKMRVTKAALTGGNPPRDKGFWLPNFDLRSKNVEFVKIGDRNMILTGNTLEELNTKKDALRSLHGNDATFITPKERDVYNYLEGMAQDGRLEGVDTMLQRSGKLATPFPSATLEDARSVIHSLSDAMFSNAKHAHAIMFDDVLGQLKQMEQYATRQVEGQGLSKLKKLVGDPVKATTVMKESLLGSRGQLSKFVWWDKTNSAFESVVTTTLSKWNSITDNFSNSSKKGVEAWADMQRQLEEAGIPNPYKAFDDAQAVQLFHKESKPADARRVVAAGNALAATMALRFFELAQPLVNMMSLPILSYSASAAKYDSAFMGYRKVADPQMPMKYMMNGVRAMHDDQYKALFQQAEDQGFFKAIVSEATEAIKLTRLREKGFLSKAESALEKLDGSFGGKAVALSDMSETLSRKVAFSTGVQLGKELYGMREGFDDAAMLIFAKNFMDRAIGNYSASQRPVLFHGTAGAAIGLFQTYMVTFAQNMYRHVEVRDFKALAGVMATQAGIFGVGGLPGYDLVSKYIGENFSENHTDLTTGLYRSMDDEMASAILYGLPSNLGGLAGLEGGGPNVSSRGAIDPRVPILSGEAPAAANVVVESIKALHNIGSRVRDAGVSETPTAFLEALSMQSISRPVARASELALGASVTRAGHTVQTPEEVYTPMGIMSRLLATRPTDEVKLRDATHLNTFYGSKDRENRKAAMLRIRNAIRQDIISQELVDEVALEYFNNGGTGQGFRSALNQAMQAESTSLQTTLAKELQPDSPLINMIMDL